MEKLVTDDCWFEVEALWNELERTIEASTEADVLKAIRMVAVGLGAEPPLGMQLKIYQAHLITLPKDMLQHVSHRIVAEYKYPTFPKPAEWMERSKEGRELIAKARVMMKIYPGRRAMAFRKYGPR